jgi:hypothetical protein
MLVNTIIAENMSVRAYDATVHAHFPAYRTVHGLEDTHKDVKVLFFHLILAIPFVIPRIFLLCIVCLNIIIVM